MQKICYVHRWVDVDSIQQLEYKHAQGRMRHVKGGAKLWSADLDRQAGP